MKDIFADLYNRVLSFFNKTDEKTENAKDVACNRLKLVLMQDRTNLTPATMDRMRRELIDLLSKYLELDRELLDLSFEHEDEQMALMLSIPVIRAKSEEEIQAILDAEDKEKNKEDDEAQEDEDSEETSEEDNAESKDSDETVDESEDSESSDDENPVSEDESEIVTEEADTELTEEADEDEQNLSDDSDEDDDDEDIESSDDAVKKEKFFKEKKGANKKK